jgi:class 3 adenylate cyclase
MLIRGDVVQPPLTHLIGHRASQVGPGIFTATIPATPWLQYIDGTMDLKTSMSILVECAVMTGAPPGNDVRTAALAVSHLRPATLEAAPFVGRARVIHTGPTFTLSEAIIEDSVGRAVAHATGHVLMFPAPVDSTLPPFVPRPGAAPVHPTPDPYLRPLPPDVKASPAETYSLPGLTLLQRLCTGDLPRQPVWELLGIRLLEVSPGVGLLVQRTSEWLCSRVRHVNPGVLACLAHSGLGVAATTLSPGERRLGIIDLAVDFFRPVAPDGRDVLCRARVVHHDGDLNHATVEITDADGNRVALGHQTSVLIKRRAGRGRALEPERVLATVLFTDIVGSTEHAERLGDAKWREMLDEHHALVRRQLHAFKGREVKTMGDGFLIAFDSPARAVQCARAVRDGVARLGLEIRAGLHSGECDVVGSDLAGIAVHVASRVQAAAGAGEVLVSSTVRDLVAGSGLRFSDRGHHDLKGLEGDWHLLAVED